MHHSGTCLVNYLGLQVHINCVKEMWIICKDLSTHFDIACFGYNSGSFFELGPVNSDNIHRKQL